MNLEQAILENSVSEVEELLDANGWPDGDWSDYNLLLLALEEGCQDVAHSLIHKGCRVNKPGKNLTPLHYAVKMSDFSLMSCLLNENASITAQDEEGNTPLHLAFYKFEENMVEIMIDDWIDDYLEKEDFTNNPENHNGLSFLHIACSTKYSSIVRNFITAGADVNSRIRYCDRSFAGFTPLHIAVQHNKIHNVKVLLELGADVCAVNFHKKSTPIHLAKSSPISEIIELLISQDKKQKNFINSRGLSHFHVVCSTDLTNVLEKFLSKKVDVNHTTKSSDFLYPSYSALHFAAECGCVNTTRLLLKNGANIFLNNDESHTPLHLAYYNNNVEIVHMLVEAQENNYRNPVDRSGLSHFHIACATNKIAIIRGFLKNKVDINLPTEEESSLAYTSSTPLHIAVSHGNIKVVKFLLANHADVNSKTEDGYTALHLVLDGHKKKDCYLKPLEQKLNNVVHQDEILKMEELSIIDKWIGHKKKIQCELVKLLLKNGIDINALDSSGRSALFYVYDNKFDRHVYVDIFNSEKSSDDRNHILNYYMNPVLTENRILLFEILLKNGADVTIKDKASTTMLHVLANLTRDCRTDEEDLVKTIIKKGVDVNGSTVCGDTPLHLAAKRNFSEMIDVLLKNKANVNSINKSLETPLHVAVSCLNDDGSVLPSIDYLLGAGVNKDAQQKKGKTALHLAVSTIMYGSDFDEENVETEESKSYMLASELLIFNIEVDIRDHKGKTALHYASQYVACKSFENLLEFGANINTEDNSGVTPVSYWLSKGPITFNTSLNRIFIKHIEKLRLIRYHVSKDNLLACEKFKELSMSEMELEKLKEMCVQELSNMKNIMIDKYTSFYDILFKNVNQLAVHVRNEKFTTILMDNYLYKEKSLPLYGYLISLQFKAGLFRNDYINPAKKSLCFLVNFNLPECCSETIFQYLENIDLINLTKAARKLKKKFGNKL